MLDAAGVEWADLPAPPPREDGATACGCEYPWRVGLLEPVLLVVVAVVVVVVGASTLRLCASCSESGMSFNKWLALEKRSSSGSMRDHEASSWRCATDPGRLHRRAQPASLKVREGGGRKMNANGFG